MDSFQHKLIDRLKAATPEVLERLFQELRSGGRDERRRAAAEIEELFRWACAEKELARTFFENLKHDIAGLLAEVIRTERDTEVICKCNNCLSYFGAEAANAEDALVNCLTSKSEDVRLTAARALGKISTNRERLVPLMLAILKNDDIGARSAAAETVEKLCPLPDADLARVIALMEKERNAKIKCTLLKAISTHGQKANGIVPSLKKLLANKDFLLRGTAAISIFRISDSAKEKMRALPVIEEILKSCATESIMNAIEATKHSVNQIPELRPMLARLAEGEIGTSIEEDRRQIQSRAKTALDS